MELFDQTGRKKVCDQPCSKCADAARKAAALITARIDGAIACLQESDLEGAGSQHRMLETAFDRMPRSLVGNLEPGRVLEMREMAARAMREAQGGCMASATQTFESVLHTWLASYPLENSRWIFEHPASRTGPEPSILQSQKL